MKHITISCDVCGEIIPYYKNKGTPIKLEHYFEPYEITTAYPSEEEKAHLCEECFKGLTTTMHRWYKDRLDSTGRRRIIHFFGEDKAEYTGELDD